MKTGIRQYAPVHTSPEEILVNIFSHIMDRNLCVLKKRYENCMILIKLGLA